MRNTTKGWRPNKPVFPITQEQIDKIENCDIVNPMVGDNHGLKIPEDFDLEEAAAEVLTTRLRVQKGIFPWDVAEKYWPYKFDMPRYLPKCLEIEGLSFDDPEGMADIVHMDDPLDFALALKKALTNPKYGGTANIKGHHNKWKQFIETVIDVNETITDYQKRYIRKVFETKYYFGLIRPEEAAPIGPILTAYEEGCPTHPAIGQGHIALSQASVRALDKELELKEEQVHDALYASYLWGFFRVMAGVHYGIDAIISILAVGGYEKHIKKEVLNAYKI